MDLFRRQKRTLSDLLAAEQAALSKCSDVGKGCSRPELHENRDKLLR